MKKSMLVLFLLFGLNLVAAANQCVSLFHTTRVIHDASAAPFPAALQVLKGRFTYREESFEGSFADLMAKEDFKSLLDNTRLTQYKIVAHLDYHDGVHKQKLRLISLNISDSNRAYNHQEFVALLHVNPELANKLGLFKVEGYENLVWIPDMTSLNQRLQLLAAQYGSPETIWTNRPMALWRLILTLKCSVKDAFHFRRTPT